MGQWNRAARNLDGFFLVADSDFDGLASKVRDVVEVELPHPVGVVVAHGLRDDPKFCRDFLGTVAFGYRLKDLKFTVDEEI